APRESGGEGEFSASRVPQAGRTGTREHRQFCTVLRPVDMFWILQQRTRFLNNNPGANGVESRPLRKGYDKLTADEELTTCQGEENEPSRKNNNLLENLDNRKTGSPWKVSDTEGNFTDTEPDSKDNDFTDDSDYEEALTCNVCDRMFASPKQLSSHKQKKRHFGCSACDSIFPSLMSLEHHKEEFEHWSDEDYLTDSEEDESVSEECERLI
ncbi:unnamed protein product, partial [Phyllotreta striolata]